MLKNQLKIAALALALLVSACGTVEENDATKGWTAQKLYDEAKEELDSGNFEKSVKYFEKLESRYPFGVFAQQAQMQIAYAYYRQGDQAQCVAAVERFIRLHPNHPHVDYMYYLRGLATFKDRKSLFDFVARQDPTERDPKAAREAFESFKQLIDRFPDSQYAEDAQARLKYLVNAMASYEVHVADYYFRRGAYVAAANRAQNVIRDYPATPSARAALTLQIRSYEKLGLKDLQADAQRVYDMNFAGKTTEKAAEEKPWWKVW